MKHTVIRYTRSICPACHSPIPARLEQVDDKIMLCKDCTEHGQFQTVIWRGKTDFYKWLGGTPPLQPEEGLCCPNECGLCQEHLRSTCCTILELTSRCNLNCAFCFAAAGGGTDRPLADIKRDLEALTVPGKTLVQLSGGEPTLRNDLPEIVRYAVDCGCKYVQLNTNGIRLAKDKAYVQSLAEAGLSFVFLQFDGMEDSIYERLRGRSLLQEKLQAIENCSDCGLGVILVVTVVPGVNAKHLGDILRFGISKSPAVRGVHFQPLTYLGRHAQAPSDARRMTLDELIDAIVCQTNGLIQPENLAPSRCDHPLCGFHGDFIALPDGLKPLTHWTGEPTCCEATADQNREFVGRRWLRPKEESCCCCSPSIDTLDGFIDSVRHRGFTVTSMAFQDEHNLDIERLRYCSTHVYKDGKRKPLCVHYLGLGCSAQSSEKEAACLHPGGLDLTRRMLTAAALPKGARIADVGCGQGASLRMMISEFGLDAVGIEPHQPSDFPLSTPLVCAQAEHLPFADGTLNAVLAECVLSILHNADAALAEAHRVLLPGGELLLSDLYARSSEHDDPGILTKEALMNRIHRHGFTVECFEDVSHSLMELVGTSILAGEDPAACTGRSYDTLRQLRCGYYFMIARKTES